MLPLLTQNVRLPYYRRVLSIAPDALIGYWPMGEPSGAVAIEQTGRFNGAYTGVDLNYPGIGDGMTAPFFDGTNDFNNVFSSSLQTAFSGAEGSLFVWARILDSAVWADATVRYAVSIQVNTSNRIILYKDSAANTLALRRNGGGTTKTSAVSSVSLLTWMHLGVTWSASADQVKGYFNGTQNGATLTTIGTFAGSIASTGTVIGAQTTVPAAVWNGCLAHASLYNRALSAGEVAELYRLN